MNCVSVLSLHALLFFLTLCINVYPQDNSDYNGIDPSQNAEAQTKTARDDRGEVKDSDDENEKAQIKIPDSSFDFNYVFRLSSASPWIALLFNIAPSLGIGSLLQGDTTAGLIGLTTELSGAAIMAVGILWRQSLEFDLDAISYGAATVVAFTGFLTAAGSIFFQMISPFIYYENLTKNIFTAIPQNVSANIVFEKDKVSLLLNIKVKAL
ncbi:MAG: hypothetical protein Ta2B_06190 [Termitinemataceae bacterium]|nr:MAG: hypothetical protein Ta2B_06190 [Termitinemataceae bacterium]